MRISFIVLVFSLMKYSLSSQPVSIQSIAYQMKSKTSEYKSSTIGEEGTKHLSEKFPLTSMDPVPFCPIMMYSNRRSCNFRNKILDENQWRFYAGEACYRYSNPIRFRKKAKSKMVPFICQNITYHLPVILDYEGSPIVVDYTNSSAVSFVEKTFSKESYFKLWLECCIHAEKCCQDGMDTGIPGNCPATWDGWSCFPTTEPSTLRKLTCSNQAYSSETPECVLESEKECFSNGIWNIKTNYSPCAIAKIYRKSHIFRSRSISIAILVCTPAILIFLTSQKLNKITRMVLHRNLLIVIVLRYILTVLSEELVLIPSIDADIGTSSVLSENGVGCRVLSFLESLTLNAMYACMLADSFYLHKVIVRTFAKEPNIFVVYVTVMGASLLPAIARVISKAVRNSSYCWMVDENGDQWIGDGFRVSVLLINVFYLVDIIRNMIAKMKHGTTSQNSKSTLKATFFLVFLFGVPILLFADTSIVAQSSCANYLIFKYASYINESMQGVMVAILFCYLNNEVQQEFKNIMKRLNIINREETPRIRLTKSTMSTYISREKAPTNANSDNEED